MNFRFLLLTVGMLASVVSAYASVVPTSLKTLGMVNPLGIESNPAFSWKISSSERGCLQSAYEIVVKDSDGTTVWSSGKVLSSRQTDIPYQGQSLKSRTAYSWDVVIYDQNDQASNVSTGTFETGILSQSEWNDARWITSSSREYNAVVEIYPQSSGVMSRYVKLDVKASGPHASADASYGFVQIAEMEIYNTKGENVARKAKFRATNEWTGMEGYGWSINYINDGVVIGETNGFTTMQNYTSTVITAEFQEMEEISRIVIYPRQNSSAVGDATKAANFPKTYTLETSETGAEYIVQYEVVDADAPSYETDNTLRYLAKNFTVANGKTISRARLYASALGVFTMTINGQPVTENVLEPGESAYDKHVLYSSYDVTNLVGEGENTIIGLVAGGLVNMSDMDDRFVKPELADNSGSAGLRAMLFITYADGTTDRIVTDGTWRSRKSPVAGSNWYGGEDYDARNEIDGLLEKGYDVGGWDSVKVYEESELYFCAPAVSADKLGIGEMRAKEYAPLRVTETWKAVSVKKNSAGNYLVDFGQNFAGTYEFSLSAPAGTTITIYDSELQANDACMFEYMYQPSGASNQTLDRYSFKGKGTETWGPKFMYHGFRYLEISGLTEQPSPECFTAKRIRSNMDQVGFFETSKSLLNDIHTICRNGIQSQLYNTVTDCPHREKLGWLDVPNMMFSSLSYNYDVKQLLNKVVMDAFDSQGQNGYVPSTVPHFMRAYDDDLNWGGAGITIPYRNYKFYGDKELMTRYYSKMKMLIDYYGTLADNNIIRNYSVLSDWGQNTCGLANYTSSEFTRKRIGIHVLPQKTDQERRLAQFC